MSLPTKSHFPLGRWQRRHPEQPFNDAESLKLASGNPALSDPEACRHSFMRVGRCGDRWQCAHCRKVFIFED